MRVCVAGVAAGLVMLAYGCTSGGSSAVTSPSASTTTGKFVWHDLSTDNLAAARSFYGNLLGWTFRDATRLGRPFVVAVHNGKAIGGMVAVAPVQGQGVSQWIGYTSVSNVEAAVAAVEKAGGRTLVPPSNVGSAGRAAVVVDPQGAPFGVAKMAADPPDPAAPEEGTFFWMEHLARDPAAAATFYTSTFGYKQEVTDRLGPTQYLVLSMGRVRAGILQTPRPEMRPVWLPYILVSDPVALAAKAKTLGGSVLLEPQPDVRKGSLAVVADPTGALVALQKYPF